MQSQSFQATQLFLYRAPVGYVFVSSVILMYYVWIQPYRGWVFLAAAVVCLVMAYWGWRIRYNLVDRRRRNLDSAKRFVQVHLLTLVLFPWVRKAQIEMANEGALEIFYRDAEMAAHAAANPDRRAQMLRQVRILLIVAFLGLVVIASVQAANEYIKFETTNTKWDN